MSRVVNWEAWFRELARRLEARDCTLRRYRWSVSREAQKPYSLLWPWHTPTSRALAPVVTRLRKGAESHAS